ncbi:hypothetical protein [Microbacterium suaedae]|uniref:hypothetical protein n=1 Tax=Microbacterium suaedae TaxID=2067813 RepID=UPI000DA1DAA1|nr:hypothetical protein [Microbacterium suaedae]
MRPFRRARILLPEETCTQEERYEDLTLRNAILLRKGRPLAPEEIYTQEEGYEDLTLRNAILLRRARVHPPESMLAPSRSPGVCGTVP